MKLFKAFILLSALCAGMAVAACFAHGPRHYGYHGRPNYYGRGLNYYQQPFGWYYSWGQPQVIIVQPPAPRGWYSAGPYGRPYYRFGY